MDTMAELIKVDCGELDHLKCYACAPRQQVNFLALLADQFTDDQIIEIFKARCCAIACTLKPIVRPDVPIGAGAPPAVGGAAGQPVDLDVVGGIPIEGGNRPGPR